MNASSQAARDAGLADLGLGVALGDALQGDSVDPSAVALFDKQVRMLDLQMINLRKETRQLGVKFLRERLHAAFELAVAAGAVACLIGLAAMIWQASRADGVSIQGFAVPPELASQGLTGAVLASKLADGLGEIEAVTNSVRAGGAVRAASRQDVKVEIPTTGVSLGDLQALLRDWLGHETPVTGELLKAGDTVRLTVRVGQRPGVTLEGPQRDLERLVRDGAEQVLAATEPYRYAVYLAAQDRQPQALALAQGLATSGSASERAWGLALWSRLLMAQGDLPGAAAKARRAIMLDPDVAAAHDNLATAQRLLGRDQAALAALDAAAAVLRRQADGADAIAGPVRLATIQARSRLARGDPGHAARLLAQAAQRGGMAHAGQAVAALPRALAMDHDLYAAHQALEEIQGPIPQDALPDAIPAAGLVALEAGDWARAERALAHADTAARMFGQAATPMRATQIAPFLALAQAMNGHVERGEVTLRPTPADCYACARVRAIIAGRLGQHARSERLAAQAVALAPNLPTAYLDWARLRLARGDTRGAIEQARRAARLAPAWADPMMVWGEALQRDNNLRGASRRFAQATQLSPTWGAPRLRRAEVLDRLGDHGQAARLRTSAAKLWLTPQERVSLEGRAL